MPRKREQYNIPYINESDIKGEKKYVIERNCAIHVDNCPISIRVWRGKSYANVLDDCGSCEYLLAESENLGNYDFPEQFLVCGGSKGIKRSDGMTPRIKFNEELYREKLINENLGKTIYKCTVCGFLHVVDDDKEEICHVCDTSFEIC